VMIFQLPEGTRLSERVEARNRLLQAYDEEVTIRRTFIANRRGAAASKLPRENRPLPPSPRLRRAKGQPSFLSASAKRRPYGVAVGCAVGAGEEAGDA
jgi:hypothetical protein